MAMTPKLHLQARIIGVLLSCSILINGCSGIGVGAVAKIHTIAIQPLGDCAPEELSFLQQELKIFFHKPVLIRSAIDIPLSFKDLSKGQRYSADSLLKWLSPMATDSITQVLGFTHEDIYTATPAYRVWGIFGLGQLSGRAAVMSDYRLQSSDPSVFRHRLRTVAMHEIGHLLGLPHCSHAHCMMNDANEHISTIDNSSGRFCEACSKKMY